MLEFAGNATTSDSGGLKPGKGASTQKANPSQKPTDISSSSTSSVLGDGRSGRATSTVPGASSAVMTDTTSTLNGYESQSTGISSSSAYASLGASSSQLEATGDVTSSSHTDTQTSTAYSPFSADVESVASSVFGEALSFATSELIMPTGTPFFPAPSDDGNGASQTSIGPVASASVPSEYTSSAVTYSTSQTLDEPHSSFSSSESITPTSYSDEPTDTVSSLTASSSALPDASATSVDLPTTTSEGDASTGRPTATTEAGQHRTHGDGRNPLDGARYGPGHREGHGPGRGGGREGLQRLPGPR